ncbi:cupin domain-containing protein [Xanthobacter flavus]|uniref:cupin domain-containing protein n=1 Tax=Xanthobacter flavus TaxID=281 RepID=UPI001AEB4582|nr:cupin domain-containing protein [Xanthobacter flavus]MBP2150856.1 transcriptional regulator with XRE-family HTH domain [Xanthobacter flavus]
MSARLQISRKNGAKAAPGRPPSEVREAPPIGVKLRHARKVKGMTLAELAEQVGISVSMLSKIERDQAVPSLHTLHSMVRVLETNIASLLAPPLTDDHVVSHPQDRPHISVSSVRPGHGVTLECLISDRATALMDANIHVIAVGGGSEGTIVHDGQEVGYVLEGDVELQVGEKMYVVKEGDSFFFPSNMPHGYRNIGATVARILWVNTPATF